MEHFRSLADLQPVIEEFRRGQPAKVRKLTFSDDR